MGDNMLRRFSVENYRNFKEKIILDFTGKRDYQYNEYCIKDGLISKMIIFGKNGAGKSNLSLALFDIVSVLTDKQITSEQQDELCFLNADSDKPYVAFEYEFQMKNGIIITYKYKKSSPTQIVEEQLLIDSIQLLRYDHIDKKITLGPNTPEITLNFDKIPDTLSVVRFIANNTAIEENDPISFIVNFANKMLWFKSLRNNRYMGFKRGSDDIADYIIKNGLVVDLQNFLYKMAGLQYTLAGDMDTVTNQNRLIEKHSRRPLLFDDAASTGTSALILFFYWSQIFKDVSFLCIDEFDAFYHFELSREIVRYIAKLNNVQALLTSHNTYLVSNELLRPDCYMTLRDGKLTSFADATPRELREGHNLEKMFRSGEFDA